MSKEEKRRSHLKSAVFCLTRSGPLASEKTSVNSAPKIAFNRNRSRHTLRILKAFSSAYASSQKMPRLRDRAA